MPLNRLSRNHWILIGALAVLAIFIYSGAAWNWFKPVVHKPLIDRYAAAYRFDPLWVMAIIKVESGFSVRARSNRGAIGLMQLLPSTARELAPQMGLTNFKVEDLQDPETNIRMGIYYLSKLQEMFPADEIAVLSSYNAGPGITKQWRGRKPVLQIEDIQYGETRRFVRQVERTLGVLKMIQGWKHLIGIYDGH